MSGAEKTPQFGQWERPEISGSPPSLRCGHSCVVVGDKMYMFGGSSSSDENDDVTEYHNDLYILHFGEGLRWEKVEQNGDIPSPREGAILIAVKDVLYLYGGLDQEGASSCAEGLYHFNTETNTWTVQSTKGPAPKALSMSGVCCEGKLVTFGGVLSGKGCNSVHILDIESLEWTVADTHGRAPNARCDHASTVSMQHMYTCAGQGSDELWLNDLFRLSLDSLDWKEVEQKGNPPSPRDYAALVAISDWYLVMFGGGCAMGGSEESFADLHYIDITSSSPEWHKAVVEGDKSPTPRYSHTMVVWGKKLYIFGGQNADTMFNDVWSIEVTLPLEKFKPSPVPRHSYSTSVPIPAPRKTVPPATSEPVKPRDFEQLRSTYVERINEMFASLSDKFLQLDKATEALAKEREAFEREKAEHSELYEQQQTEMRDMMESHRTQNEEWLERMRNENDAERRALAEERAVLERAQEELAKDREVFAEKSRKLDAIMKQVQGLQEP